MTTSPPINVSELQLYRVLQRANLLQYYDTFIAQGGDDVQQLCEAGEEEFLEIMALVGMASKPLHVRRLQKALQEWVTNPAAFQQPVVVAATATAIAAPIPSAAVAPVPSYTHSPAPTPNNNNNNNATPTSHQNCDVKMERKYESANVITAPTWSPSAGGGGGMNKSASGQSLSPVGSCASSVDIDNSMDGDNRRGSPNPIPILHESQIKAIGDAAERLAATLPYYEPKPHNLKKQLLKEIETVMALPLENPYRMDEIRKYAAIYGRFDSKRKNEKPMSLHEISVNEAAAQLCKHMPTLLTRREDLFPLARHVVRESGYQYSKGHSSFAGFTRAQNGTSNADAPAAKKPRHDAAYQRQDATPRNVKAELDKLQREERLAELNQEFSQISDQQQLLKSRIQDAKSAEQYSTVHLLQAELEALSARQLMLLTEQSDVIRKQKRSKYQQQKQGSGIEDDGTDSSNMASGGSSPRSNQEEAVYVDFTKNDIYPTPPRKNVHRTQQYVNESLYEEGLRIAQQYGMSDFAEELKGMKPDVSDSNSRLSADEPNDVSDKKTDEQREWEGEIEEDQKRHSSVPEKSSFSKTNGNSVSTHLSTQVDVVDKTDVH